MTKVESSCFSGECDVYDLYDKFSEQSECKFFLGNNGAVHKEYQEIIHFDFKSLRRSTTPLALINSVNCKLSIVLAPNASARNKTISKVLCSTCKCLLTDL